MNHPVLFDPTLPMGPWMRAIRSARDPLLAADLAPTLTAPWGVLLGDSEWKKLILESAAKGKRPGLYGERIEFGAGTGWGTHYGVVPAGLRVEKSTIQVSPHPVLNSSGQHAAPRWNFRAYDLSNAVFSDSAFFGTVPEASDDGTGLDVGWRPGRIDEHLLYGNLAGNVLVDRCVFVEAAAQGFQGVFRENHETTNPAWMFEPGLNEIQSSAFLECGRPWGKERGGFAVSFFQTGQDALIEDSIIRNVHGSAWKDGNGLECRSYGALLFEGRTTARAVGCWIEHRLPDKETIKASACESVVFERCRFHHGEYGADSRPFRIVIEDCGSVVFRDCVFPELSVITFKGDRPLEFTIKTEGPFPVVEA